jgi:hypothetical protein
MIKIKIFVITFALAILSWSCECVVDSDPNAIITPTEFANVLFINTMPNPSMKDLYVYSSSKYIKYLDTINNTWTNLEKDYKKVGLMVAGVKNIIRIVNAKDTNETFFNSVLNLSKDSNYTFVAYGKDKNVQSIMKNDYLKNYISDNVYMRCYNASADAPELLINIMTEGFSKDFQLKSGKASELSALPNGIYTIRIRSIDSVFSTTYFEIKFSQGKINNLIFKGSYKLADLHYGIVTAEIPR